MAAVGDVGTSSFEFYEGIRIVIPGFFAFGTCSAVSATLDTSPHLPDISALGAVLGVIAAGLLLYFVDAPAKAVAHRTGLPSDVVSKDWGISSPGPVSNLNMFFVMVDAAMPAPIRARGLYKGSIYKIGYEAIVLASAGVQVVGLVELSRVSQASAMDVRARAALAATAGGLLVLSVPLATLFGWLRMRHRSRVGYPAVGMTVGDVAALSASGLLLGAYAYAPEPRAWWLMVGACAISYCHFLTRMHRGRRKTPLRPEPLRPTGWARSYLQGVGTAREAVEPAFLCIPLVLAMTPPYLALAGGGLPATANWIVLVGWTGVAAAAVVLIVARGHEKGLHGAYATQKAWMQANRERLVKDYFSPRVFGLPDPQDPDRPSYM